jgi:fructose-1,6-bisphosphatase/inositol monophosphatase family enzyme
MTVVKYQHAIDTALAYIRQVQSYLMPVLAQQQYRCDDLFSTESQVNDPNPSYRFDEISNCILFEVLKKHDFSCHVFSEEEHSWKTIGSNPQFHVICDPFCNSFLASRTFRDAAVAICISDLNGQLAVCAIGDLQIRRIYYADTDGAYVLEDHQGREILSRIRVSQTTAVEDAFVVTPLLKTSRRNQINSFDFFHQAKIIHGVDGAIMIARLAAGYVDAYLDPIKGQPFYEIPCCELIIKAGGIVTDNCGKPFSLGAVISELIKSSDSRFKIVAACTNSLHQELLHQVNLITN